MNFQPDLKNSVLKKAKLAFMELENSQFDTACLNQVDFSGANLKNAIFGKADVADTNFTNAQLHGADLTQAINLSNKQIFEANIDDETKVPPAFEELKARRLRQINAPKEAQLH